MHFMSRSSIYNANYSDACRQVAPALPTGQLRRPMVSGNNSSSFFDRLCKLSNYGKLAGMLIWQYNILLRSLAWVSAEMVFITISWPVCS